MTVKLFLVVRVKTDIDGKKQYIRSKNDASPLIKQRRREKITHTTAKNG